MSDLADIHMKAVEESFTGAFNLGTGTGNSVREVIAACERVTGREIVVNESPRREGDPPVLVASTEKAAQEIGWAPRFTDIEETIRTAWSWHEAHPDGYGTRKLLAKSVHAGTKWDPRRHFPVTGPSRGPSNLTG